MAVICPKCGTKVQVDILGASGNKAMAENLAICRCLECSTLYCAEKTGNDWKAVYPLDIPTSDERIPQPIRRAFEEVYACLAVNAVDAAVLMCRTTLQRIALDKKAKGEKLDKQIDYLFDTGVLPQSLKEEADD